MTKSRFSSIYHLFPLGAAGNGGLRSLEAWIEHASGLGFDAMLLGPVFASHTHGYDAKDYRAVDPRLGDWEDLRRFARRCEESGLSLMLDGVFNHTGRDFFAFKDLLARGRESPYAAWYRGVDFSRAGPLGEPFTYERWAGHASLPRINGDCPDVRDYFKGCVARWIDELGIKGLRLDAADCLSTGFVAELAAFCRARDPGFWFLAELIHGDYGAWIRMAGADSATNYEAYKGLWSSCNDGNFFEIAYSLNRQFGPDGIYKGLHLQSFLDNHDVSRIASQLHDEVLLYPLHCLLWAMPGIPSLYYGSEGGLKAEKRAHDDWNLRPALSPYGLKAQAPHPDLIPLVAKLNEIRRGSRALREGGYLPLWNDHLGICFIRRAGSEAMLVTVNARSSPMRVDIELPFDARCSAELLGGAVLRYHGDGGRRAQIEVPPRWAGYFALEAFEAS